MAYKSTQREYESFLGSNPAKDILSLIQDRIEGIRDQLEVASPDEVRYLQGQAEATRALCLHIFETIPAELREEEVNRDGRE